METPGTPRTLHKEASSLSRVSPGPGSHCCNSARWQATDGVGAGRMQARAQLQELKAWCCCDTQKLYSASLVPFLCTCRTGLCKKCSENICCYHTPWFLFNTSILIFL